MHPEDREHFAERMTAELEQGTTTAVLRLPANDGGWVPLHVTISQVELDDGVTGGLVTLRLPTEAELADVGSTMRVSRSSEVPPPAPHGPLRWRARGPSTDDDADHHVHVELFDGALLHRRPHDDRHVGRRVACRSRSGRNPGGRRQCREIGGGLRAVASHHRRAELDATERDGDQHRDHHGRQHRRRPAVVTDPARRPIRPRRR